LTTNSTGQITTVNISEGECNPYIFKIVKSGYETLNFTANITTNTSWQLILNLESFNPQIKQWTNISSWNITHIEYNLSIWGFNSLSYDSNFNITPDSNWGSTYNIVDLATNTSNTTIFSKTYERNQSDYTISISKPLLNNTYEGNSLKISIPKSSKEWTYPQIRQWINVSSYTFTTITYNLSIWVFNSLSYDSPFNVTPDSNYGSTYNIATLTSNTSNITYFSKTYTRPQYPFESEQSLIITTPSLNNTWNGNSLLIINPYDPPSKHGTYGGPSPVYIPPEEEEVEEEEIIEEPKPTFLAWLEKILNIPIPDAWESFLEMNVNSFSSMVEDTATRISGLTIDDVLGFFEKESIVILVPPIIIIVFVVSHYQEEKKKKKKVKVKSLSSA